MFIPFFLLNVEGGIRIFLERGGQNQDLQDSQDEQDFDELSWSAESGFAGFSG